jgi:beta-N-acetylhexosaminidase
MKKILLLILLLLPFLASSQTINADTSGVSFTLADFYLYNPRLESRIDEIFGKLTDAQRAGQMIIQAAGKLGKPTTVVTQLVKAQQLGGVILLGGTKAELTRLAADLSTANQQVQGLPLLFSSDAEPSLVNRITGTRKVKKTSEIASMEECSLVAKTISQDLLEMGVRHNFAPVCDISPSNVAIGNRSFGNSQDTVVWMSDAFIQATQQAGIAATAKHFPGHGFVKGDSHQQLIYVDGELQEIDTYKPLISNGVISVMVGHIAVINNEVYNTEGLPSSCSRKIVTDLLQHEMGFKGLVVTDAMNMGALNKIPQAPLKAVQAGCDMILMPKNEITLINSILQEMQANKAFKSQVYTSVKKILRLKICLGLM